MSVPASSLHPKTKLGGGQGIGAGQGRGERGQCLALTHFLAGLDPSLLVSSELRGVESGEPMQ